MALSDRRLIDPEARDLSQPEGLGRCFSSRLSSIPFTVFQESESSSSFEKREAPYDDSNNVLLSDPLAALVQIETPARYVRRRHFVHVLLTQTIVRCAKA